MTVKSVTQRTVGQSVYPIDRSGHCASIQASTEQYVTMCHVTYDIFNACNYLESKG